MKIMERIYDVFELTMMTGEFIARMFIAFTTIFAFGYFTKDVITEVSTPIQILVLISMIAYIIKPLVGFLQINKIEEKIELQMEVENAKEKSKK